METCNNCNPCGSEEINLKFGEAAYTLFKRLKYGIATCCDENYELDVYNKELCELNAKLDDGLTPTNFECENITELYYSTTCNTITLIWGSPTGVNSVDIEYKIATASTWISYGSTTNSTVVISGLTESTTYSIRIKTYCNNASGEWLEYQATTIACEQPEQCVDVSNVVVTPTCYGAVVTWTNSPNTFGTLLEYQEVGDTEWYAVAEGLTSAVEEMTITGLDPDNNYIIRLQTACIQGNSSNEVLVNFQTLDCPCPLATITLTPTCGSISVAWVVGSPADAVEIEYQQDGDLIWSPIDTMGLLDGSYTLTELNELTQFNFRVRSICNDTPTEWITYTASTYECCAYRVDEGYTQLRVSKSCEDVCVPPSSVTNGYILYRNLYLGILDCNNEPTYPNDVDFTIEYEVRDCDGNITTNTLVYTLPAFASPQLVLPYIWTETCCCYLTTGGISGTLTNIISITNNAGL